MGPPNAGAGKKSLATGSIASRKSHHTGIQSTVSKSKFGTGGSIQASRTMLSSSKSGRNLADNQSKDKGYKPPVTVIDADSGKDVTPQPLLFLNPSQVRKNQSNLLMDQGSQGAGTPTDLQSQASIYQGTVNQSTMFGGGPFTRSVFSASGAASDSDTISVSDDAPIDGGSHHAATATTTTAPADLSSWAQIQREDVKEDLNEADLDKTINLTLTETSTIWLLDITGTCYSNEDTAAKDIKARNEKYDELCKSRVGNDLYTERGMVTFNDAPKLKVVQTDKIGHTDVSVTASNWDMHDTFLLAQQLADAENPDPFDISFAARPTSGQADEGADKKKAGNSLIDNDDRVSKKSLQTTSTARGTVISKIVEESRTALASSMSIPGGAGAHTTESVEEMQQELQAKKNEKILSSQEFKDNLFIMERAINLNTYQAKLACYRGFEPCVSTQEEEAEATPDGAVVSMTSTVVDPSITSAAQGPNLERLWCYLCPLTRGKNVSCSAWNQSNPDLIAFGYGQFEFVNQKGGLVACWSLKNPDYPERLFHSEIGVTAMDFSEINPNLLAVGFYDGTIAVYNVKQSESDPVLDTFENNQRHTGPIWQLKWVEKEKGKGEENSQPQEVLISISADGRVCQWTIRKGFECGDLMKLKRIQLKQHVGGKAKGEKKGDALISRLAGGFCFAFSQIDPIMYIAGTEEGYIHKCSCSYNEQYLETFEGHGGPVYDLKWSPFCKNLFLSCSADWSIRLWKQDRLKPILSFFSSTKSVNNICWSPYSSTVFACVNDYAVEVWDLAQSTLDPIIVAASSGPKMTTVTFASNSESILVGDNTGQVLIYQLKGMPPAAENQEETLTKIVAASLASQLQEEEEEAKKGDEQLPPIALAEES